MTNEACAEGGNTKCVALVTETMRASVMAKLMSRKTFQRLIINM